jgi:hypothetical protein
MDIPVSKNCMNLMWNTDKEYMAGLRYILTKIFELRIMIVLVGLGFG